MSAYFDVCVHDRNSFAFSEIDAYRLLCHALIQSLPDAAMAEATESLSDLQDYKPLLPYASAFPKAGPSISAEIGPTIIRPIFPVVDEE